MSTLLHDIRYAWRVLWKAPSFTALIVITLALGIGANTAIFSVVNAMLFEPLPYRDSNRLAFIWLGSSRNGPLSGPDFHDIREGTTTFEDIGGIWASGTVALTDHGDPEELRTALVTTNFFRVLGVGAALGRTFGAQDTMPGAPPTILIAWDLFQRRFGGDRSILGRQILVNEQLTTVIGVMPETFRLLLPLDSAVPDRLQVWQPVWPEFEQGPRGNQFLRVVARMKPGVTIEQARSQVDEVARRIGPSHAFTTVALHADDVREIRGPLLTLFIGVNILLLIACVNVGSLLIARAASRANEMAVRLALGSNRARLLRQSTVEAIVLTVLGASAGVLIGYGATRALIALAPESLSRIEAAQMDASVLAYSLGISMLVAALLSLVSATPLLRVNLLQALANTSKRSSLAPVRYRARAALMIVQATLSVVLLVSSGLIVRAFVDLRHLDLGFQADHRLTLRVALSSSRYSTRESLLAGTDELRRRLAAIPGVISVGAISHLPYDSLPNWGLTYAVDATPPAGATPRATTRSITTGLFETLDMQLLEGRRFTDNEAPGNPVVIVDDVLARRLWPGRSAVGQRLSVGQATADRAATVVGVVRHVRLRSLMDDTPQIFVSFRQLQRSPMAYVVRTSGESSALSATVRAAVAEFDTRLPIYDMRTLDSYVGNAQSILWFTMLLAALFAAAALALTCIGVYGVLAYAVASRIPEFGLRRALGADTPRVMWDVAREGMTFVLAGCAVGLVGAIFAARLLQSQLQAVRSNDPIAYGLSLLLILIGTAVACWIPGRRAISISPLEALRAE
jgi:putative ABC transport system permease protein